MWVSTGLVEDASVCGSAPNVRARGFIDARWIVRWVCNRSWAIAVSLLFQFQGARLCLLAVWRQVPGHTLRALRPMIYVRA